MIDIFMAVEIFILTLVICRCIAVIELNALTMLVHADFSETRQELHSMFLRDEVKRIATSVFSNAAKSRETAYGESDGGVTAKKRPTRLKVVMHVVVERDVSDSNPPVILGLGWYILSLQMVLNAFTSECFEVVYISNINYVYMSSKTNSSVSFRCTLFLRTPPAVVSAMEFIFACEIQPRRRLPMTQNNSNRHKRDHQPARNPRRMTKSQKGPKVHAGSMSKKTLTRGTCFMLMFAQ